MLVIGMLIIGILTGIILGGFVAYLLSIASSAIAFNAVRDTIYIIQAIVIILATIFSVNWTYKTFGFKEKLKELEQLKEFIFHYHQQFTIFCSQVRDSMTPDQREINELLNLVGMHNKLIALTETKALIRPELRKQIQDMVGKWLPIRKNKMQRRKGAELSEEDITREWQAFNEDYDKVNNLLNKEMKLPFKVLDRIQV